MSTLSRRKKKTSPKSSATSVIERDIIWTNISQIWRKVKKLVLVLVISTPITGTREEVVEIAEIAKVDKDGKESEDEYSENLA